MLLPPIVDRELRVESRKNRTYWIRVIAALVALLVGCAFYGFGVLGNGKVIGSSLFAVLTWICLAAALAAGLFLTSDCLSEEKREGTLGFLFLTNLRGYDVVLGKLLATSLLGFYALLALFPILAMTLLMGGVSGTQFWQTSLALTGALLLSLNIGLYVSARSRDSQKAMFATLFLLVLVSGAGPLADALVAAAMQNRFDPLFSLSSPAFLFVAANRVNFWPSLATNLLIAGWLLVRTCIRLPVLWQEGKPGPAGISGRYARWVKYGTRERRAALRGKWMEVNPVTWLSVRERWHSTFLWLFTSLMAVSFIIVIGGGKMGDVTIWKFFANAMILALYLGITSQACRFFVDSRRTGLLELLLVTPLSANKIIQGHWRALVQTFALPVTIILAAHMLATLTVNEFMGMGTATNISGSSRIVYWVVSAASTLVVGANLVALCWFGMWTGLKSKTTHQATLRSLLFVLIIPWFAIMFVSGLAFPLIAMSGTQGSRMSNPFFPIIVFGGISTLLSLAKDFGFTLWASRRLRAKFREVAMPNLPPVPKSKARPN